MGREFLKIVHVLKDCKIGEQDVLAGEVAEIAFQDEHEYSLAIEDGLCEVVPAAAGESAETGVELSQQVSVESSSPTDSSNTPGSIETVYPSEDEDSTTNEPAEEAKEDEVLASGQKEEPAPMTNDQSSELLDGAENSKKPEVLDGGNAETPIV